MTPYDPEFDRPVDKFTAPRPTATASQQSYLVITATVVLFGLLWTAGLLPLTLMFLMMMASAVVVIVLAMIPSALGYWLFSLFDRAWARRVRWQERRRWPDDDGLG